MKAEWAPSEPLLVDPAVAQEVAEAENLFQCAAAAHLLLAREMLEQNTDDEEARAQAKAQATADLQQQVRFRELAVAEGDKKLAEIKTRLAGEAAEQTADGTTPENSATSPEKAKTLAETYLAHTMSFYDALAGERYAVERTNRMPSESASRANWIAANVKMAEFAFAQGDLANATEYYQRVENPVRQWELVAKVHATHPLLAEQWRKPLDEQIEKNAFDTTTTLAMYKAGVATRFNQLATIPEDKPEYTTLQSEIRAVWVDAKQLLDNELKQSSMAPWNLSQEPAANQDARVHLIAFAKLFYANGDMQTAKEITKSLKDIQRRTEIYQRKGARGTGKETTGFLATAELRELCYGRTWNEVKANAKDWLRDEKLSNATRTVCANLVSMQDPGFFDKRIIKNLPEVSEDERQSVAAYLEETYEGVSYVVLAKNDVITEQAPAKSIAERLQTTDTTAAFQEYYELLAQATVLDRANEASHRISMFERFEASLRGAKQAPQAEKSGDITITHLAGNITSIVTGFTERRRDAVTDKLPDIQLEAVAQLERYIELRSGMAEIDEARYDALIDALNFIAPQGVGATNRLYEKVKAHCEFQLRALKAIPDETITAPRAEALKALLARVTPK